MCGDVLAVLLIFTGLGRRHRPRLTIVKAQLSKAVDGAALAAARNLNSGSPKNRGDHRLQGELPGRLSGHHGRRPTRPIPRLLPQTSVDADDRASTRSPVTATRHLPTTFMQLGELQPGRRSRAHGRGRRGAWWTCRSCSTCPGSIGLAVDRGAATPSERSSTRSTQNNDRVALLTFSNGASGAGRRCRRRAGSTRPR